MDEGPAQEDAEVTDSTPLQMLLEQFSELPNLRIWEWMARVMKFEVCGLPTTHIVERWPMVWLDAFCAFRSRVNEIEEDRRKRQAEFEAATRSA